MNHPDTASTTELQNTAASLFLSCPFSGQVRSVASGRVVNGFLGNDWVGPSDLMNIKPCKKNAVIPRDMARCWRSCIDTWSLILIEALLSFGLNIVTYCNS